MSEKLTVAQQNKVDYRQQVWMHRLEKLTLSGVKTHELYSVKAYTHSTEQMNALVSAVLKGCDISNYKDPKFSAEQIEQISKIEAYGLDKARVLNPSISANVMNEYFFACRNGVKVSDEIDLSKVSPEEMHQLWCEQELPNEKLKVGKTREQSTSRFEIFREAQSGTGKSFETNIQGWGLYDSSKIRVQRTLEWNKPVSADRLGANKEILEKCGVLPKNLVDKTMMGYELYNVLNNVTKNDKSTGEILYQMGFTGIDYEVSNGSKRTVIFNEADQQVVDTQLERLNAIKLNKIDKTDIIRELQDLQLRSDGTIKVNMVSSDTKVGNTYISALEAEHGQQIVSIVKGDKLFINMSRVNSVDDIRDLWLKDVASKEGLRTLVPDETERKELLSDIWTNAELISKNKNNVVVGKIVKDLENQYDIQNTSKEELGARVLGELSKTEQVKQQLTSAEGNFLKRTCKMIGKAVKRCFGKDVCKCESEKDLLNIASSCARVTLEKGFEMILGVSKAQKEVMQNEKAHFLTKEQDIRRNIEMKKGKKNGI